MKKKGTLVLTVLVFILAFALVMTPAFAAEKATKPITLNFVSFAPAANVVEFQYLKKELFDKINKLAKGRLVINVKGGPEVVPPPNLGKAVKNGVIDMATIPNAFFEDIVPGIGVTHLSPFTAAQERKNGVYDAINKLYKKAGLFYLGRGEATEPGYFILFLNKPVEKQADFKGMKLGGSTSFHGMYKELGSVPTTIHITDYNTAMERGVVDGLVTSIYIAMSYGLNNVSKYVLQPGIWRSSVALTMNLAKWNKIPPDLQKMIIDEVAKFETKYAAYEIEQRNRMLKKFTESGAKLITLSPDVAKWFVKASTDGAWKYAQERQPGDIIPKMKKLLTEK
jgi:TRAP-type C4-dicarboxylate transport system substrate-binding protein